MHNPRHLIASILGLVFSASLLAGCGGSTPEPPVASPAEPAVPTEPVAASPEAPAAAPAADLSTQNYCFGQETLFHVMETEGFWVNICGGDRPDHYIGVSKKDGNSLRVALKDYRADGLGYEAYNGTKRYQVLLHGEDSPRVLLVTDGAEVLVQQAVQQHQQLVALPSFPGSVASDPPDSVPDSPIHNYCGASESVFLAAETPNFWLNICGGDCPHHYVGVAKKDGQSIRLELTNYDPQGQQFTASNGPIRYEIFLGGDPEALVVTDTSSGRVLVREQLLNY